MRDSVDDRIQRLATVICMPTRRAAVRTVFDQIKKIDGFGAVGMPKQSGLAKILRGFAERVRSTDPVLGLAFDLVALSPDDVIDARNVVAGATGLLCSAAGDTSEARARLRVWDDLSRGKHADDDFFEIAEMYWRDEMKFIVATIPGAPMRDRFQHPALQALMFSRWDAALGWVHGASVDVAQRWLLDDVMSCSADRVAVAVVISNIVEDLYAVCTPSAGALALAWAMLTADPRKPESFRFLPQLQFAIDHADLEAEDDADVRARIRIWWRAAEAEWTDSEVSIFRIADIETPRDVDVDDQQDPEPELQETSTPATLFADLGLPTLVVMPSDKATKLNNFHAPYKELVDAALPLVVARDVVLIRATLHGEFPHATTAIDLILRDLRDGKPFWLKPICLVSAPGAGKSRLVRRVADLVRNLSVYRFDASSSSDNHFGGTSKAWSNTEPSVPARAVAQGKIANPVVLIDEIDKAAANHNGSLHSAMLAFLDRETAGRYRDQSLDSELDLSMVSYIATANSVERLPLPLRDRFRIIKVPTPTLQDLPQLVAQIMRDLAIDDDARSGDAPLAGDELDVCGKAWSKAGFSMRKLQAIVRATLEARDQCAMRH